MNATERKKTVLAMEFLARQINDEYVFDYWLVSGVADGDLKYGEWDPDAVDDYYIEDKTFAELMECFLRRMREAKESSGLYCDGIVSGKAKLEEAALL